MATSCRRLPVVFLYGSYWRCDISWRTNGRQDQHFADEWTTGINEVDDVWYEFSEINIKARNDADLMTVDQVSFTFATHADITSALDQEANSDAEIRLWWSANGLTNWVPIYWGVIDYDDIDPDTEAIVGGTWIKAINVQTYDALSKLKDYQFYPDAFMDDSSYVVSSPAVNPYLGSRSFTGILARLGPNLDFVLPTWDFIEMRFFLEQPAKLAFEEHEFQTVAAPLMFVGLHPTTEVGSDITFMAETSHDGSTPAVTNTWDKVYFLKDYETTEFRADYDSWADCVAEMAFYLGWAARTRHTIESGHWVRTLNYVRIDGANDCTISYSGVLISSKGGRYRRVRRSYQVTSRYFRGGHPIDDYTAPRIGETKSSHVHHHTVGTGYGTYGIDNTVDVIDCNKARNVMWNAMFIEDPTDATKLRAVTHVGYGSTFYPATSFADTWDPAVMASNGLAQALANYYSELLSGPQNTCIESELSDIRAYESDRGTTNPSNWFPYAQIGDDEIAGVFRVLEVRIDAQNGVVRIIKEKL